MPDDAFTETAPEQLMILDALRAREPIFHRPQYARTHEDFARLMAPDYWEIGASGRRYSREFILRLLAETPPVDAEAAGWQTSDFACRSLGPDTFLLTYRLQQRERPTRRTTIWFHTPAGWQILFHQGTVITTEDRNVPAPAPV